MTTIALALALLAAGCLGATGEAPAPPASADDPAPAAGSDRHATHASQPPAEPANGTASPNATEGGEGSGANATTPSVDESLAAVPVRFTVVSRAGGVLEVNGRLWAPPGGADVALLAIHGSSGIPIWGPVAVPGYSFAHHQVAEGRAVVAIDLPGYGGSEAVEPLVGMEDYALAVHQMSEALRSGDYAAEGAEALAFPTVVGAGFSMGGAIVDVTQGTYHSFDAIVPAGWSHGGWSQEAINCFTSRGCPEDPRVIGYHIENADPAVMNWSLENAEEMPMMNGYSLSVWGNAWTNSDPRPDDVTRTITVPVLVVLGAEDWWFDKEDLADEPSRFPNAETADLILLPETGHAVYHHLNHGEVRAQVDAWLDEWVG